MSERPTIIQLYAVAKDSEYLLIRDPDCQEKRAIILLRRPKARTYKEDEV